MKFLKQMTVMLAIVMIAFTSTSCKKDQPSNPPDGTYDVKFNINSVTQNSTKSLSDINCSTLKADYVTYKIDGGNFITIPVFYVGNIPWTNSIKLTSGTHTLNEFIVYSDNGTPTVFTDDIVLSAAPHTNSIYGTLITNPLDYTFNVTTDDKNKILLDVVCFETSTYENFGFVYFKLNEMIVREQWFYGDFCIKDKADYVGSHYALRTGWEGVGYGDVPAIFKIEVWRGGLLQNTFTNDDASHEYGNKVAVNYIDYKNQTDIFIFKLFIYVKQGSQFVFLPFKEWTFNDQSNISEGTDGMIDFVLGNCYDPNNPPDLILAPWMNLPDYCSFSIQMGNQSYFDVTLSNFVPASSSYDIVAGLNRGYCGDLYHLINLGQTYTMNIYSSLYLSEIPAGFFASTVRWDRVNWLFNNLDQFSGYVWQDIQSAIWRENNGFTGTHQGITYGPMAQAMYNAMVAYGNGFTPPPGGWACIIFTDQQGGNSTQLQFIKVDP